MSVPGVLGLIFNNLYSISIIRFLTYTLFYVIIGVLLGVITGLTPGVHTNLLAVIIVGFLTKFSLQIPIVFVLVMLTSMVTTNIFLDYIPSILLGLPEESTALSVLPGHRLVIKGLGFAALITSMTSTFVGILILFLASPVLVLVIPKLFFFVKRITTTFLIIISIFLISSHGKRFLYSLIVFLTSGFLGFVVLNSNIKEPLLPLFSGLFGLSIIMKSLFSRSRVPKQELRVRVRINPWNIIIGSSLGLLTILFPGVSSSMVASLTRTQSTKDNSEKIFLERVASVNSSNLFLGFIGAFTILKYRNGVLVVMSRMSRIDFKMGFFLLIIILITSGIALIIGLYASKAMLLIINNVDYKKLNLLSLIVILLITILISGYSGVIVLFFSTLVGLLAQNLGVRKTSCMGSLLFPIILWRLGIRGF